MAEDNDSILTIFIVPNLKTPVNNAQKIYKKPAVNNAE